MNSPIVSIIMSVHNGASSLNRCLKSIQMQTFKEYEIICIDDASTDKTSSILLDHAKSYSNNVFQIITNKVNIGLTKSLNRGIIYANGPIIARIDADDWWEHNKLSKQINILKRNQRIGVLGTWCTNHRGTLAWTVQLPTRNDDIKKAIFRKNPFAHSSVLIQRALLEKVGCYDEKIQYGQDLDLWFRLLPHAQFANIPEYLCHRTVNGHIDKKEQMMTHIKTTHKYIQKYNAPLYNYAYMAEPLAVAITPRWIRNKL